MGILGRLGTGRAWPAGWSCSSRGVALLSAAVLDQGPDGTIRATLFPVALTVWDPFVQTCTGNSLVLAAGVAWGSLVLGGGAAWIAARRRFWGRVPLFAPGECARGHAPGLWGPGTVSGCSGLQDPGMRPSRGAGRVPPGPGPVVPGSSWRAARRWWPWRRRRRRPHRTGLGGRRAAAGGGPAPSVPAVDLAGGLARIAPAVATVFALTLVEPGAPLVLGLRRTLAFQVVEAASAPTRRRAPPCSPVERWCWPGSSGSCSGAGRALPGPTARTPRPSGRSGRDGPVRRPSWASSESGPPWPGSPSRASSHSR